SSCLGGQKSQKKNIVGKEAKLPALVEIEVEWNRYGEHQIGSQKIRIPHGGKGLVCPLKCIKIRRNGIDVIKLKNAVEGDDHRSTGDERKHDFLHIFSISCDQVAEIIQYKGNKAVITIFGP